MEEVQIKKERSSNFTQNEILTLLQIAKKNMSIIECKKTDSCTWKEKDDCWNKITDELNCQSEDTFRTKKSVKSKYDDLKKNLKKKLGKNKVEIFKTGGGKPCLQSLTAAEEILMSFLDPATMDGLPPVFDSDIIENLNMNLSNEVDGNIEEIPEATEEWLDESYKFDPREAKETAPTTLTGDIIRSDDLEKLVRTPRDGRGENKSKITKGVNTLKKSVSRELRTYPKISPRMENISALAKAKEELVQLQKEILEEDRKMKKETDILQKKFLEKDLELKTNRVYAELEINDAQVKSLQLDIQIKEAELLLKKKTIRVVPYFNNFKGSYTYKRRLLLSGYCFYSYTFS